MEICGKICLSDLREHRWAFREINSTHKDLLINLSSDFCIPYILFPFSLCTSVTLESGPEEEHTVEIKRPVPRKPHIRIRWDADAHLCWEKKARGDILQRWNNYAKFYPCKKAPPPFFFFLLWAFHLKKQHLSPLCETLKGYLPTPSAGVRLFLAWVYPFKGSCKAPIICIHI